MKNCWHNNYKKIFLWVIAGIMIHYFFISNCLCLCSVVVLKSRKAIFKIKSALD